MVPNLSIRENYNKIKRRDTCSNLSQVFYEKMGQVFFSLFLLTHYFLLKASWNDGSIFDYSNDVWASCSWCNG